MSSSLRVLVLSSILAACFAASMHKPVDTAASPLDAVEAALSTMVHNPRLTAAQMKSAKMVTVSVDKIVDELESKAGQLLSKEAKASKVALAMKQLQGLEDEWQQLSTKAVSDKKADLTKQLEEKEGELAKEQKQLKVVDLEKKLAEKKLALEKLVEAKNVQAQAASQQEAKKQAAARQEMVANVLSVTKTLQAAQGQESSTAHAAAKVAGGKSAVLKTILAHLQGRMANVTATLSKLDAAEKKREAELKAAAVPKAPANGDADAMGKGASLFKMLAKKAHRQFEKAKAPLKSELKELTESVSAIKKGDIKGLTKVMAHMQGEMKNAEAKSGNFLY